MSRRSLAYYVTTNRERAENEQFALGVVLLAAGASTRMGRPKLLLPWKETTLLGHSLALWRKSGAAQSGVVCAANDSALHEELNRLGVRADDRIVNPAPARGMFSSIQCAAAWGGWGVHLTHFAIMLGDQPHLQVATLRALIDFSRKEPERICQPTHRVLTSGKRRPRHPVILPRAVFALVATSHCQTLRDFLRSMASNIELLQTDDPGLDLDVDTPADYENALRLAGCA